MDWLTLSRIKCGDGSILRMSFDSLLVSSTVAYYKMMYDVIMARLIAMTIGDTDYQAFLRLAMSHLDYQDAL